MNLQEAVQIVQAKVNAETGHPQATGKEAAPYEALRTASPALFQIAHQIVAVQLVRMNDAVAQQQAAQVQQARAQQAAQAAAAVGVK